MNLTVSFEQEAGARQQALAFVLAVLLALLGTTALAPDAGAVTIEEFNIGATPTGITAGPDGNLWVTTNAPSILRVSPAGVVTARYPLAGAPGLTTTPEVPTFSGDSLWFTIYRLPTQGGVPETTLARRASNGTISESAYLGYPRSLAAGPGGSVWFPVAGGVGRVAVDGQVTTFGGFSEAPYMLASDAAGRLWATTGTSSQYAIQVSSAGAVTQTKLPGTAWKVATSRSSPVVWFAGRDNLMSGYSGQNFFDFAMWLEPGADGTRVPTAFPGLSLALDLAIGPDGNAWETDQAAARIGRIAPSGRGTVFTAGLGPGAAPALITAGPGDSVWFTDTVGRVGRITLDRPTTTTESAVDLGQTGAVIAASVTPNGAVSRVRFEYGATTGYGTATRWRDVGDGDGPVTRSARLDGLEPDTTYHYRALVTSAFGTTAGPDRTLTTQPQPPAPPADLDDDGYAAAVDCNDDTSSVFPGAIDVPGDGIDQDCIGGDAPLPRFFPHVTAYFTTKVRRWSRFTSLTVDEVPAGAVVQLGCSGPGCRFRSWSGRFPLGAPKLKLLPRLRGSKLRASAVLELRLMLSGHLGTVVRWTVGPPPRPVVTCLRPGAKKDRRC